MQGLPPEVQSAVLKHAVSLQASGSELTPEKISDELATVEGTAFLLWLLARGNHPELTPQALREHITEDTVDAIHAELLEACGLMSVDPNLLTGETGSATASPKT